MFKVLPAETVDSYELGAKTALLNRTLFIDGSVFLCNYSNFDALRLPTFIAAEPRF